MKIKAYFFLLLLFNVSCGNISDEYLTNIDCSKVDNLGINIAEEFLIVVRVKDNIHISDLIISNHFLYYFVFKEHYSENYDEFIDFLDDVLSQNLLLPKKIIKGRVINPNNIVLQENKKNGFDFVKNKYSIEKGNKLVAKYPMPEENYYSLIKIMFEHNYYILEDDYSGEYWFFKALPKRNL
jgi:hypothetical protein